jgi:hypothetical protein
MEKRPNHGKAGSPFGGTVTQFPDQPDDSVQVKTPDTPEPEEAKENEVLEVLEDPRTTALAKQGNKEGGLEAPENDVENSGGGMVRVKDTLPTILDFIPEETAKLLSEEQRAAMSRNVNNLGYWSEAAMICKDHACAFKDKCHFFRAKVPRPVGEDCPIELAQMHAYKVMLTGSLSNEDAQDPFLAIQINDIVHIMMMEARAYGQFGIDGGVIEQDDVRGFNPISGEHVVAKVVHRAIAILEKTGKRKERLLAKLLATPQDRAKADRDGVFDRSKKAAEIGARIAGIAEKRKGEMKKRGREIFVVERVEVEETEPTQIIDVPSE